MFRTLYSASCLTKCRAPRVAERVSYASNTSCRARRRSAPITAEHATIFGPSPTREWRHQRRHPLFTAQRSSGRLKSVLSPSHSCREENPPDRMRIVGLCLTNQTVLSPDRQHWAGGRGGVASRLGGAPLVAVVQPADLRSGDHATSCWRRDETGNGCILVHGKLCSCS